MRLITRLRQKRESIDLKKDIFAGIVVALVSVPISMGYAQIAGLPPVFGLYGSLLPILIFGLLTTSCRFVVGVDAMPAAMVGGLLAQMGIAAESKEALGLVPLISLLVGVWFFILFALRAGRIVKYISVPVMAGFISGVGATIILMQIPKLFGGTAGTGEVVILLGHIAGQGEHFHLLSFLLGFGTIVIILICRKMIPNVPMTVIMMIVGALLQAVFRLDEHGVKVMASVASGLPKPVLPGFVADETGSLRFIPADIENITNYIPDILLHSLGIAAVVMAQTLLASGSYARRYHEKLDGNAELLAYGAMNLAGAFSGACPINGSVSRSGIADTLKVRSQVVSITASVTMLLILLFGTPMMRFLPVPVLTGIVVTALIGILEIKTARKLWRSGKTEFAVFMIAFLGVLFFGTIYGVVIGVLLSFGEMAVSASVPPTAFVGRIPGHGNFYSLKRNSSARPIKNTVVYRFSGNLFFANIDRFCDAIEEALKEDTKQVVVDARGIGSIDVTATERLVGLWQSLKSRGIRFYLSEHDGSLNDQLAEKGGRILIEEGAVKRTITLALKDAGLEKPYELEGDSETGRKGYSFEEEAELHEHEWTYGEGGR